MNRSLISTLQFQSIEPQKHCNSVFLISNFQISPPKIPKKTQPSGDSHMSHEKKNPTFHWILVVY